MIRGGDDKSGFTIDLDARKGLIVVQAWGFWSDVIALAFKSAVADTIRGAGGLTPRLELDTRELKPLREEGQAAISDLFGALRRLGSKSVVIANRSELTKLQLLRLVKKCAVEEVVTFS